MKLLKLIIVPADLVTVPWHNKYFVLTYDCDVKLSSESLFNSLTQRKYTNKQALKVISGLWFFKPAEKRPSAPG